MDWVTVYRNLLPDQSLLSCRVRIVSTIYPSISLFCLWRYFSTVGGSRSWNSITSQLANLYFAILRISTRCPNNIRLIYLRLSTENKIDPAISLRGIQSTNLAQIFHMLLPQADIGLESQNVHRTTPNPCHILHLYVLGVGRTLFPFRVQYFPTFPG